MTRLLRFAVALLCFAIGTAGGARAGDSTDADKARPGWSPPSESESTTAGETLRVASGRRGTWDGLVTSFGIEQGLFRAENLSVEVQWTDSDAAALQAALSGDAALALGNDMIAVIEAYAKGAPVRVISAEMTGASDLYWYVRADRTISAVADLTGRPMAFSRPGTPSHLAALALVDAAKIRPQLIPTGDMASTRTLVMAGQIDAGWAAAPFDFDLLAAKRIRIIARGSDVPALAERTLRVNVSSVPYLAEHREAARRFLKAYAAAVEALYADPARATNFFARESQLAPELAKQMPDYYPKQALALLPVQGLPETLAQARQYKTIDAPVTEEALKGMLDIVDDPGQ
jgi:NitT/TauT family transport system substrate-binding protein